MKIAGLSEEEMEQICGGNAARIFKLTDWLKFSKDFLVYTALAKNRLEIRISPDLIKLAETNPNIEY